MVHRERCCVMEEKVCEGEGEGEGERGTNNSTPPTFFFLFFSFLLFFPFLLFYLVAQPITSTLLYSACSTGYIQ